MAKMALFEIALLTTVASALHLTGPQQDRMNYCFEQKCPSWIEIQTTPTFGDMTFGDWVHPAVNGVSWITDLSFVLKAAGYIDEPFEYKTDNLGNVTTGTGNPKLMKALECICDECAVEAEPIFYSMGRATCAILGSKPYPCQAELDACNAVYPEPFTGSVETLDLKLEFGGFNMDPGPSVCTPENSFAGYKAAYNMTEGCDGNLADPVVKALAMCLQQSRHSSPPTPAGECVDIGGPDCGVPYDCGANQLMLEVPHCSDPTVPPMGQWAVLDLTQSELPAECSGFSLWEKVPDSCCTNPEAFNMAGESFEELYIKGGNMTCPVLSAFGMNVNVACMADGSIAYGEGCGPTCAPCASPGGTFQPGCYKAGDFPGTAWFMHSKGCACGEMPAQGNKPSNVIVSADKPEVPICSDTAIAPMGQWAVFDLNQSSLPAECSGFDLWDKVPDSCCTNPEAFNMAGESFDELYTNAGDSTCPVISAFGINVNVACMADGSIAYGEGCGPTCAPCASPGGRFMPGCYKANDIPGTAWFMHSKGCGCTDMPAEEEKPDEEDMHVEVPICSDTTIAPMGQWAVLDLTQSELPAECSGFSLWEKVPDSCCTNPEAFNMAGESFDELYIKGGNMTCPVLSAFGMNVNVACMADGSIAYGEGCGPTCAPCASPGGTFQPGCYKAGDFPGTAWFMHSKGCACGEMPAQGNKPSNVIVSAEKPEVAICSDTTIAPMGQWAVFDLSQSELPAECSGFDLWDKVPDSCCTNPAAFNMAGESFDELYTNAGDSTCPVITAFGINVNVACMADGSIAYGEGCGPTCAPCASPGGRFMPGCYKANDIPGTAWFMHSKGCACTDTDLEMDEEKPDDEETTCGEVKAAYQANGCCGNPMKSFKMDRRLSKASGGDDLMTRIEEMLKNTKATKGEYKARQLAKKIQQIVDANK